jgi:hypothetical protein
MTPKQIVLAATALLVAASAHATVIEIPLPGFPIAVEASTWGKIKALYR